MKHWFSAILLVLVAFSAQAETAEQRLDISFSSPVFATKGEVRVTQAEFDAFLARVPEADRAGVIGSPERIGKIIEDLLLTRLLANEAIKTNLHREDTVATVIYQSALVILAENYIESLRVDAELEDYASQARELYLSGSVSKRRPKLLDFSHILIGIEERSEAEAARMVLDLSDRIHQGESFDQLAEQYSDDPTFARNAGRFEQVDPEALDPGFAQALAQLSRPGEIAAEPVRTDYGWHIIRLDAQHEGDDRDFEEMKGELMAYARSRHLERVTSRVMGHLTGQSLEIKPGAVQQLLERYGLHDSTPTE